MNHLAYFMQEYKEAKLHPVFPQLRVGWQEERVVSAEINPWYYCWHGDRIYYLCDCGLTLQKKIKANGKVNMYFPGSAPSRCVKLATLWWKRLRWGWQKNLFIRNYYHFPLPQKGGEFILKTASGICETQQRELTPGYH